MPFTLPTVLSILTYHPPLLHWPTLYWMVKIRNFNVLLTESWSHLSLDFKSTCLTTQPHRRTLAIHWYFSAILRICYQTPSALNCLDPVFEYYIHTLCMQTGSCVLMTPTIECQSIPAIDTSIDPRPTCRLPFGRHVDRYMIDTRPTTGDSRSSVDRLMCQVIVSC